MCGCGCNDCTGMADLARVYGLGAIPAVEYPLDQPYQMPPAAPSRAPSPDSLPPMRMPDMPQGSTAAPSPPLALSVPGGESPTGMEGKSALERIPWGTLLIVGGGIYLLSQVGKGKHR